MSYIIIHTFQLRLTVSVQVSSVHFSSGQAHTLSTCEPEPFQLRLTVSVQVSSVHFSSGQAHTLSTCEPEPFQLRLTVQSDQVSSFQFRSQN